MKRDMEGPGGPGRGSRGPRPAAVALDAAARAALERLARAHTTGQALAQRARIVLAAADGLNNAQIGVALGVTAKLARRWRRRWLAHRAVPLEERDVAARLRDAPRPGAPPTFTAEQLCQIVALACEETPAESERPISHWTPRELADEAVKRHIVDRISVRTVGRFLVPGGGRAPAPPDAVLAHPTTRRSRAVRGRGAGRV
jgi:putative transposase